MIGYTCKAMIERAFGRVNKPVSLSESGFWGFEDWQDYRLGNIIPALGFRSAREWHELPQIAQNRCCRRCIARPGTSRGCHPATLRGRASHALARCGGPGVESEGVEHYQAADTQGFGAVAFPVSLGDNVPDAAAGTIACRRVPLCSGFWYGLL